MPDCVAFSRSAARVNEPSSQTAITAWIWRNVGRCGIKKPYSFGQFILFHLGARQQLDFAAGSEEARWNSASSPCRSIRSGKDWRKSLREDREAFILADQLGFTEGYVGEHVTDGRRTSPPARSSSPRSSTTRRRSSSAPARSTCRTPSGRDRRADRDARPSARRPFHLRHLRRAACCPMPRCSAISTPTGTPCSSKRSTRSWRSGLASRPTISKGKYWNIAVERQFIPKIGQGFIPKPLQRPHPPIVVTAVAPFSKGVTEAAARGWEPISANFLMPQWVKSHWPKYVEGCERAAVRPIRQTGGWRKASSSPMTTRPRATTRPRRTALSLLLQPAFHQADRQWPRELFKTRATSRTARSRLDSVCNELVIYGSPDKVADELLDFPRAGGGFRHAALCRQGLGRLRAWPSLDDPARREGDAEGQRRDRRGRQGQGCGIALALERCRRAC